MTNMDRPCLSQDLVPKERQDSKSENDIGQCLQIGGGVLLQLAEWCARLPLLVTDQVGGQKVIYTNPESITGYTLYYGILSLPPKLKITFFVVKVYMKIYLNKMIDKYIQFFSKIIQGLGFQSWLDMILKILLESLTQRAKIARAYFLLNVTEMRSLVWDILV